MKRVLAVCLFGLLAAGCASTQKMSTSDLYRMQTRLDILEGEVRSNHQEMGSIQRELSQLRQECVQSVEFADDSYGYAQTPLAAGAVGARQVIRVEGVTAEQIQRALKKAGFYEGNIDGKIGPRTQKAIKEFQKANQIKVDGIVGRMTWSKLKNNL